MKKLFYLFLIVGLLSSCDTTNVLYTDLMLPTEEGVFRGISFNMPKSEVYDLEMSRSTVTIYSDDSDESLIITTDMGSEVLNFADVTYNFDDQGLYGISVQSYAVSLEAATEVFDLVIKRYTELHGKPTVDESGFSVFNAKDAVSGLDYSISVKNIVDLEDSYGIEMFFDLI